MSHVYDGLRHCRVGQVWLNVAYCLRTSQLHCCCCVLQNSTEGVVNDVPCAAALQDSLLYLVKTLT